MCGKRGPLSMGFSNLLAEHRRHQILPGLVRDGDVGFQGIDNTKRVVSTILWSTILWNNKQCAIFAKTKDV